MASYCEVCQGLYSSPHPHLQPVPCGGAARRGLSWPRVGSRRRPRCDRSPVSPMHVSYNEVTGGDVDGSGSRLGGGAYTSASPPLPPGPASHLSPYRQRSASSPAAAPRDGAGLAHVAASSHPGLAGALQGRYRDATYCSLRRADGAVLRPDYLRRGEGRGCIDVPADDTEGEKEVWAGLDDFDLGDAEGAAAAACAAAVPPTSSWWPAPHVPGAGKALEAPDAAMAAAAAEEEDAGGQPPWGHAPRTPNRASPCRVTIPPSPSTAQQSSSLHHAHRGTPAYRSRALATDEVFGPSHSSHLPSASWTGAPVPAYASRTAAAAMHPPRSSTTLTHDTMTRTAPATRPEQLSPPQAERSRESLADLVAKIRAEVSKELGGATAASGAHRELDLRRHRRYRATSARPSFRTAAAAVHATTDDGTATGSSPRSSSASHERSTETRTRSAPASTRHRQHRHDSARGYRYTHASEGRATADRARHRHPSRSREHSSRVRRTASTSSSVSSTSSAEHLRRTVKAAESALCRMQQHTRQDGSGVESDSAGRPAQRGGDQVPSRCEPAGTRAVPPMAPATPERDLPSSSPPAPPEAEAQRPDRRGHLTVNRVHRTDPPSSSSAPPAAAAATARSPSATPSSARSGMCARTYAQPVPQPHHTADAAASQEAWRTTQEHRLERLREGLAALCSAVRRDLQKVRDEVRYARSEAKEEAAAAVVKSRAQEALASAAALQSAVKAATTTCRAEASAVAASAVTPASVVSAVAQCTPAEQRRIAALLLPHLRPLMEDVVQAEVQHQLQVQRREQQAEQHAMEQRLHAYVAEAVASAAERRALAWEDGVGGGGGAFNASATSHSAPWAGAAAAAASAAPFSSPDALDAHLRATARAVLHEEDERRYGLANENERRHERRVQRLQEEWQASLRATEARWRAEWAATLERESSAWTRRARAPLQQHADVLQDIVTALTRDVTHLQEQQEALSAEVIGNFQQEREMRSQEQARLAERLEQRVLQRLPSEADAACVRFHVLREQRLAPGAASRSASAAAFPGTSVPSPRHSASAEELRLSVVQPAMDHMRRLLVSHQEMLNASVEDRCQRAEHAVEDSRHVWMQNVAEVRSKLSALRGDVRGAFGELCENLNVAAPAL